MARDQITGIKEEDPYDKASRRQQIPVFQKGRDMC
jgi:hypothetical protein